MALVDKVNDDIKAAMLAREKDKLEAIRAIKAALLLAQTSGEAVTEEIELKLLQKLVKQRKESAEIYSSQNRQDLADKEIFEAEIIEKYLPTQLSEEELQKVIAEIISQNSPVTIKEMGKIIGIANKQLAGKADGKSIAEIVKKLLA
ncbi:MAG: GatB/YqeY domain-containing protein [Bacteroidales bacterium]|nr:GatB/YqeY domain-containing protein [Bacteroidales bacterium]